MRLTFFGIKFLVGVCIAVSVSALIYGFTTSVNKENGSDRGATQVYKAWTNYTGATHVSFEEWQLLYSRGLLQQSRMFLHK